MGEHKNKKSKTKWICGSPFAWGDDLMLFFPSPSPAGVVASNMRSQVQIEYKKLFFGGKDEGLLYDN